MNKRLLMVIGFVVCTLLRVHAQVVPLSTDSATARSLFEDGLTMAERLRRAEALERFIAATKVDPNFAMAHLFASKITSDPRIERHHAERAKALAHRATKGEQLFIRWLTKSKEGDFIAAIAAMNEFIAMYPNDKRSLFFFSSRTAVRTVESTAFASLEHRVDLLANRVLKIDPDYVPALNNLAYGYALLRQQDKAIETIRRTIELRGNEVNPHDSMGDILRMAGRYEEALEHYHQANAIVQGFSSQGIADTLALMGRCREAREEYARAGATLRGRDALVFRFQSAVTYIHEKDFGGARAAFSVLAEEAHRSGIGDIESDAYRAMSMLSEHPIEGLDHSTRAESALQHKHTFSQAVREEKLAGALRFRATWLLQAGRAKEARAALDRISRMANNTRNADIQHTYYATRGALSLLEGRFSDAVAELREVPGDPFAIRDLATALERNRQPDQARAEIAALDLRLTTVEYAVVRAGMAK
jgi:tetratricopeptide (TPR) repeat protein